jgi:hypothetical protein
VLAAVRASTDAHLTEIVIQPTIVRSPDAERSGSGG